MDLAERLAANPFAFALVALLIGAGLVILAKLYGLVFMSGKSPHRVGEMMRVNRAEVTEWSGHEGYVDAGGELWQATSQDALTPGDAVTVSSMDGLVLVVKKKRDDDPAS